MKNIQKIKYICIVIFSVFLDIFLHIMTENIGGESKLNEYSLIAKAIGSSTAAALWAISAFSIVACVFIWYKNKFYPNKTIGLFYGGIIGVFWLLGNIESVSVFGTTLIHETVSGLCDAVPIMLLIILLELSMNKNVDNQNNKKINNKYIPSVFIFALVYIIGRYVLYFTKIINSGFYIRPFDTLIWTILMGSSTGIAYILFGHEIKVTSKLASAVKFAVIIFGSSWVVFQAFIPLLFAGTFVDIFVRSTADIIFVIISYYLSETLADRKSKI